LQGKNAQSKTGWRKLVPFLGRGKKDEKGDKKNTNDYFVVPEKFNRKKPIFINDDNITQYKFKPCCHPIPGDDILGFIDGKHQIEIHKRTCPVAARLKASFGNRLLDAKWDMHKKLLFDATIRLQGIDRVGMLLDISQIISSQLNVNMRKLTIASEEGVFDGTIEIRVHDREDVGHIINQLKTIEGLQDVTQIL
jgi:GTP pyrophosphokinase